MAKKILKILGISVLLSVIVVGVVYAFTLGSTDGVWGEIDSLSSDPNGADCDQYGRATSASYTLGDVIGVIYNVNYGPGGEDERYVRNASVCEGDINGDGTFAEWTRYADHNWGGLGSHTTSCDPATGLYISEYVWNERSGDEQLAVEIYNGTGASINLSAEGWSLIIFTTDVDFDLINLTGTVADEDVYVVVNDAAAGDVTGEDQTISNDDDYRTVLLIQNYTYQTIDAIDPTWPDSTQDDYLDDENMVRYGRPENWSDCPDNNATGFTLQSGFGYEGVEDRPFEPAEGQYFPVGRYCHYNYPVYAATNRMVEVPLNLTVNDISCPAGQTLDPPGAPDDLTFQYLVTLDETTNSNEPCDYGTGSPQWPGGSSNPYVDGDTGPNRNGCADLITFNDSVNQMGFTCRIDELHTQDYTVSILGFTPTTAGAECPDVPEGTVQFNQVYTAEWTRNCYCVYGAYTQDQITPVTLKNLSALAVEDGILISWETTTEVNNFGFNIYRAEQVDGEKALINEEIIISEFEPGGMFGALYEYLDETAEEGVTYYYWLEDVPMDSDTPVLFGPISAVR